MTNPIPAAVWNCLAPLALAAGLALFAAPGGAAPPATMPGGALPGPDELPAVAELPDPFRFDDGSRVQTAADWERRRAELVGQILGYEYGRIPPPAEVKAEEQASKKDDAAGATEKTLLLTTGPEGKISTRLILTLPDGKGPFPVIVKGDLCWGRVAPQIVADVTKRGYALAEFDRTAFAPDSKEGAPILPALYPAARPAVDCGALAAWAWGFHRVVDYVVTRPDIDAKKIVVTGHSRGGKAALLAGALDTRVSLTVPNGSGCGGAGCYRVQPPKTEDIAAITGHFPYWFGPRFPGFVGRVDKLPFDQHEVKALVAPRALFTTDALGDVWANGPGTQATYQAAREVFDFLGAADRIGLHYREGKHEQNAEDFAALLDFADHLFAGKAAGRPFDKLPFPDAPKAYSWSAPRKG